MALGLVGVSVGLTGAGTSAAAELTPLPAASANPNLYRCVKQPDGTVPVPPLLPGAAAERAAAGNPPPACSGGMVPEPIAVHSSAAVRKVLPKTPESEAAFESGLVTPAIQNERPGSCEYNGTYGVYYCHVFEARATPNKRAYELGANMIVDDPPTEPEGDDPPEHSITQLWAIDGNNGSDVEFGYAADPGYWGDVYSHLFVTYANGGQYPFSFNPPYPFYVGSEGSPYVVGEIVSEPGQLSEAFFAVQRFTNGKGGYNWWFYINGYWIGYMTEVDWNLGFPISDTEIQVGGEVEGDKSSPAFGWVPGRLEQKGTQPTLTRRRIHGRPAAVNWVRNGSTPQGTWHRAIRSTVTA